MARISPRSKLKCNEKVHRETSYKKLKWLFSLPICPASVPVDLEFIVRSPGRWIPPGQAGVSNPHIPPGRCTKAILSRLRCTGSRCPISHDCPIYVIPGDLDSIPVIPSKLKLHLCPGQRVRGPQIYLPPMIRPTIIGAPPCR